MGKLTFIDMFAGIGGFRSGMEQAGYKCVGWIEWDKFARQSYQAMYNTEGEFNGKDIQQVKGEELPNADVWCFGFPCQDVSVAGKQAGIRKGTRSGLFFEVIRLLEERATNKQALPKCLFAENVKNLLSIDDGWGFARVQIEMDKAGYDVEWSVLDSAEVVPQHRERTYIIGHLRGQSARKVFPIVKNASTPKPKSIKVLGNLSATGYHAENVLSDKGLATTLTASSYKHVTIIAVHQVGNVSKTDSFSGNPQVGRVYAADGLAPTLNTMQGGGREPKIQLDSTHEIRKLTPLECWRLQGFSDEQFYKAKNAGLSNTQLYKQSGNSVTVPVIRAIAERLG